MSGKRTCSALLLAFPLSVAFPADLVLIANPTAQPRPISRNDAINIFMGRLRMFPAGGVAKPLDLPSDAPEKALFYRQLVGKEPGEIDAYWARLVFSGRTRPPKEMPDQQQVVEHVARHADAIGYVDRSQVDERVRIVLELAH